MSENARARILVGSMSAVSAGLIVAVVLGVSFLAIPLLGPFAARAGQTTVPLPPAPPAAARAPVGLGPAPAANQRHSPTASSRTRRSRTTPHHHGSTPSRRTRIPGPST